MNTATKILSGFAIAIILFLFFRSCTYERKWNRAEQRYNALLDSVANAKPKVDTTYILTTERDTVTLWRSREVVRVDTVHCPKQIYTGRYDTDLLSVRWQITLFGELQSVDILPGSSYRFREITIEKTITLADTRPVVVPTHERSHLWLTGGVVYSGALVGGSFSLTYTRRGKWGISAGVLTAGDKIYYQGGILIRLK